MHQFGVCLCPFGNRTHRSIFVCMSART